MTCSLVVRSIVVLGGELFFSVTHALARRTKLKWNISEPALSYPCCCGTGDAMSTALPTGDKHMFLGFALGHISLWICR